MEMLKKLQSTVAQAVTQVSGVLPGNPVTREYEVKEHIASAGPGESIPQAQQQGVAGLPCGVTNWCSSCNFFVYVVIRLFTANHF